MTRRFVFKDGLFAGMAIKIPIAQDQSAQELTACVVRKFIDILDQHNLHALTARLRESQFALLDYKSVFQEDSEADPVLISEIQRRQ